MPRDKFMIIGTPQLTQPESVYRGMETSDATAKPTRRPAVPEINAEPGRESIYLVPMRQGLRIK
jgi:hypothetical protein